MKKFLIGLMILGLASLGYSQSTKSAMEEVKLSDVEVVPINAKYLDNVQEGNLSNRVFTLEKKASRYNIKESPFFNIRSEAFEIRFKQNGGRINAVYDRYGKIITAYEWHKDILLPKAVRNAWFKQHPDWNMLKNTYLVSYNHKKGAKKVYKIQIQKDGLKKTLKFDIDGNQLN